MENIWKRTGILCNANLYIGEYLVFSVSTTAIADTKKQQINSYIFSPLPHIFTINREQ